MNGENRRGIQMRQGGRYIGRQGLGWRVATPPEFPMIEKCWGRIAHIPVSVLHPVQFPQDSRPPGLCCCPQMQRFRFFLCGYAAYGTDPPRW